MGGAFQNNIETSRARDQLLVDRVRAGDKKAFNILFVKYQARLKRLLSKALRDTNDVEDAVQETFLKAYRSLGEFRGDSAFYTWLYRIGINTAKNMRQAKRRRAPVTVELDIDEEDESHERQLVDAETPESVMVCKEISAAIEAALDALPIDLRTALVLREIEGLSYQAIAEIMLCPLGTVRSRIARARESIAEKLARHLDFAY